MVEDLCCDIFRRGDCVVDIIHVLATCTESRRMVHSLELNELAAYSTWRKDSLAVSVRTLRLVRPKKLKISISHASSSKLLEFNVK